MIQAGTPAFRKANIAFALGALLTFANLYFPQPLLPVFSKEFGLLPIGASLTLASATITMGLSLLFYGVLSDTLGRKNILIWSLSLAIVVTAAIPFTKSFEAFLALRALQGVFLGGISPIAVAYLGEEYSKKALPLAVGIYVSSNCLGGIAGRLLSGTITHYTSWRNAYLVMTGLSILCLAGFIYFLPPSKNFVPQEFRFHRIIRTYKGYLKNPIFLPVYLIGGLNCMVFVGQYNYITFVLSEAPYNLSTFGISLLFLTYTAGVFASNRSAMITHGFPQSYGMGIGILCMGSGILLTAIPSLWAIGFGFLLNCFGMFLTHSTASVWVGRHATVSKGAASALYFFSYYLGSSLGNFYLEPFWRWSGWYGVIWGSLLVLIVTTCLAGWLYQKEYRQSILHQ